MRGICNDLTWYLRYLLQRIATLIVESILFGFVAIKAIQAKTCIMKPNHDLFRVLIKDGSLSFLCVFGQSSLASGCFSYCSHVTEAVGLWTSVAYQVGNPEKGDSAIT